MKLCKCSVPVITRLLRHCYRVIHILMVFLLVVVAVAYVVVVDDVVVVAVANAYVVVVVFFCFVLPSQRGC